MRINHYNKLSMNKTINKTKSLQKNKGEDIKDYTVLYYFAGNNNIADDMIYKTRRLEKYGSNKDVNVLVQMAQPHLSKYPDVSRFYIIKDKNYTQPKFPKSEEVYRYKGFKNKFLPELKSPVLDNFEADSSSVKTLSDSIIWAMKNYPSKHFVLVLMDHGYGFLGTIIDNTKNNMMSIKDVKKALKRAELATNKKIDVLVFDSCLMQQAEVADGLKDVAKVMVASEEVEFPYGMPEAEIVKSLQDSAKKHKEVDLKNLSKILVDTISKEEAVKTVSAIDLGKIKTLVKDLNKFAKLVINKPDIKDKVKKAIKETFYFCKADPNDKLCTNYRDIKDFALHIIKDNISPDLTKASKKILHDIDSLVLANKYKDLDKVLLGGLSIYLPADGILNNYDRVKTNSKKLVNPRDVYKGLDFAKESLWDEMLESLK